MPVPLIILAAWVGQQLASNVESEGWSRIKALIVGDPQVKDIAEALKRSIDETVDNVAVDGSGTVLREAIFNAFAQYGLYRESSAHETVLDELRSSIDCTLRESGLNSEVPAGSITQLEFLAPGISLELLVGGITRIFVRNIKKMATAAGSPLNNLSKQLNADEVSEALKRIDDTTLSADRKVDAVLEITRHLLDQVTQNHQDQDQDRIPTQAAAVYETMKLIHKDYLLAFAEAEKMLSSGVSSEDLIYFLENRRATLAVERIQAAAQADLALTGEGGREATKVAAFAHAVSAYFDTSDGPTRITYFTGLLTYIRGMLQIARDKEWSGDVRFDGYFLTTADHGKALVNAIASARVDIQRRFEDIAREFVALDS
jgi:hypothetical protein